MLSVPPLAAPAAPDVAPARVAPPLVAPAFATYLAPPDVCSEVEARLILDAISRGQDVALVCGDNRLDAYGLLARARARGLEEEMADGVTLARAFTLHQFVALVEETLPRMVDERRAGLALVTGVLEPFGEEDVTPAEARVLLPRTMRRLGALAKDGLAVAATGDSSSRLAPLARACAPCSDVSLLPLPGRQRTLEAFPGVA